MDHQLEPAFEEMIGQVTNYDPLNSDVHKWIKHLDRLFDNVLMVSDEWRPEWALLLFMKHEYGTELKRILEVARGWFGPISWDQFKEFMIEFDRTFAFDRRCRPV